MAWDEAKAWMSGSLNDKLYQSLLDEAAAAPARNARRKKIVRPEEMPWEMSRQGLLKHLLNEQMNTRMETVDAYMQVIPPGSRSGKHRHLAEECLYVLEGYGYDLHQDCDVEITDTYEWVPAGRDQALRVGSGRRHLRSAQHHPPALQRRPAAPGAADLLHQPHLQELRAQRSRTARECAGIRSERRAHRRVGEAIPRRCSRTAGVSGKGRAADEDQRPQAVSSPVGWVEPLRNPSPRGSRHGVRNSSYSSFHRIARRRVCVRGEMMGFARAQPILRALR